MDSTGVPTPDLSEAKGREANVSLSIRVARQSCTEPGGGSPARSLPLGGPCATRGRALTVLKGQLPLLLVTDHSSPVTRHRPFLIATRAYSRKKLTRRKQKMIRFSNRYKIHFSRPEFLQHGSQTELRISSFELRISLPGRPMLIANRGRPELTNVSTH